MTKFGEQFRICLQHKLIKSWNLILTTKDTLNFEKHQIMTHRILECKEKCSRVIVERIKQYFGLLLLSLVLTHSKFDWGRQYGPCVGRCRWLQSRKSGTTSSSRSSSSTSLYIEEDSKQDSVTSRFGGHAWWKKRIFKFVHRGPH